MSYLKFHPHQIFTGSTLLPPEQVLVTDNNGIVQDIIPLAEAGENVQQVDGILSPGFINCHCHLELSHMKGLIKEHTGLVDFVFGVVTQRHFSRDDIQTAIQKAEEAMMAEGVVAVGDICNNTDTLAQKKQQTLAYYNFIEVSGWLPTIADTRYRQAVAIRDQFESHSAWPSRNSICPHAPYSVSPELWQRLIPHFSGKTITIHNQETAFEDELFTKGTGGFSRMYELMKLDTSFFTPPGTSSLQYFFTKLRSAAQVVLVHNTFTTEADIDFVNSTASPVNWCLCINANQYIENAVPPADLLHRKGCRIVIGTDSLASNHSLSVLDEMKTLHRFFPDIAIDTLLTWATSNGATALQMDDTLGSFSKGKKPGINLLRGIENGRITERTSVSKLL